MLEELGVGYEDTKYSWTAQLDKQQFHAKNTVREYSSICRVTVVEPRRRITGTGCLNKLLAHLWSG